MVMRANPKRLKAKFLHGTSITCGFLGVSLTLNREQRPPPTPTPDIYAQYAAILEDF